MPTPKDSSIDATRAAQAMAVLGRLQAACASDTSASLMAAHMSLSCAGRLRSASSDGVIVEVPNPPTSKVTMLGTTAAVSFPVADKMVGFVAEIIALRTTADGTLLATLELPQDLQVSERRAAVRISVPRGTLRAAIIRNAASDPARAIDISLSGILIELDDNQVSSVAVGQTVTLSLILGDTDILVDAEICRRDGPRFGLRYVTENEPPKGLAGIIYQIQEVRRPRR